MRTPLKHSFACDDVAVPPTTTLGFIYLSTFTLLVTKQFEIYGEDQGTECHQNEF